MGRENFVVFIDEAGDEGFKFQSGSSEWFVLTAVVVPAEKELGVVKLVDDVREVLKVDKAHALHFRDLRHERRLPFIDRIAKADLRFMSVLGHKPSLAQSGVVQRPRLYFYCARLLLERVSWLCRDTGKGNCRAKVIFSHRASTPYRDFVGYLEYLRTVQTSVAWEAIDPDNIISAQHAQLRGLQIADAVCGSVYAAVRRDERGFTEPRYIQMLRPVIYRYGGRCRSYGLKFYPNLSVAMAAEERFNWYREVYGN